MTLLHMVLIYFSIVYITLVEKKIYIHDEHKPGKFLFA